VRAVLVCIRQKEASMLATEQLARLVKATAQCPEQATWQMHEWQWRCIELQAVLTVSCPVGGLCKWMVLERK